MLYSKPDFLRRRLDAVAMDILAAAAHLDSERLESCWRSLQAISNEVKKIPALSIPLDDSMPLDHMSDGHSETPSNDGGHKVQSSTPEPVLPSGGAAALWNSIQ